MTFATARNIVIILALAALVAIVPGGGTAASVLLEALWLAFIVAMGWVASLLYRQHRTTLYGLGEGRRALLYGAVLVLVVTITATHRLWETTPGRLGWLALVGGSVYAGCSVIWAARRY